MSAAWMVLNSSSATPGPSTLIRWGWKSASGAPNLSPPTFTCRPSGSFTRKRNTVGFILRFTILHCHFHATLSNCMVSAVIYLNQHKISCKLYYLFIMWYILSSNETRWNINHSSFELNWSSCGVKPIILTKQKSSYHDSTSTSVPHYKILDFPFSF